ncbi:hypothetical protein BGZ97_010231, partial [Linnemannia gamsii]
ATKEATVEDATVEDTTIGSRTGNIHEQPLKEVPEIDRLILEKLCPAFSEKDLAAFGNEMEQEPITSEAVDENDDSNDNKNEPLLFLLSLCNAVHSRTLPNEKGIGVHVCAFINQANRFLPPITKHKTSPLEYAGSAFLRSAAVQLSVELRKHYKNGSIELCKKIETLKRSGQIPSSARGHIDPKKSAIENFVLLNRVCGSRRSLVPVSSFDDKFVTLSELDLTKIFWPDPDLRLQLQLYALPDFPSIESPEKVSQSDFPYGHWGLLRGAKAKAEILVKVYKVDVCGGDE